MNEHHAHAVTLLRRAFADAAESGAVEWEAIEDAYAAVLRGDAEAATADSPATPATPYGWAHADTDTP